MSSNPIATRALLVRLQLSQWSNTKSDSNVSVRVAESYKATHNAGSYQKKLVDSFLLQDFRSVANAVRQTHQHYTMPWLDGGYRLLPNRMYFEYMQKMREHKTQIEQIAKSISERREQMVANAKKRLGDMYNEADIPSAAVLRESFALHVGMMPVPNVNDWRLETLESEAEDIREQVKDEFNASTQQAVADLYERAYSAINHMYERLSNEDARFRASMITDMRDLVGLLPKMNVMGDEKLDEIAEDMRSKLCQHEADALRTSPDTRNEVATQAKAILDKMNNIYGARKVA